MILVLINFLKFSEINIMYSGSRLDDFDGQGHRLSREVDTNVDQNSVVQYKSIMSCNEKKRNYHRYNHDQIQNLEAYVGDLKPHLYLYIYTRYNYFKL